MPAERIIFKISVYQLDTRCVYYTKIIYLIIMSMPSVTHSLSLGLL